MIGTNIRGIRHLWRVSGTSLRKILVRCNEHGYDICEVIKTSKDNTLIGERMFIFNSYYNSTNFGSTSLINSSKEIKQQLKDIEHTRILEIRIRSDHDNLREYNQFFNEIYLLPEDFDEMYNAFFKENAKMMKSLRDKYGIEQNSVNTKRLYLYTDGSKNFFQWAANLYSHFSISMRTIQNILTWNEYYKQLTKHLSKGTITAYNTPDAIVQLIEELSTLRNEKRLNDAINSFNTAQKKLLKNNELSDVDKQTLSRFSKLSDTKRINFIKKVSTIEDFQELMRQMRHVTSVHFDWNKESFMDFIQNVENINYEKIFENENVVLVKVIDYETIKQLGKTTNWCISKNKSYWNNYIEHHNGNTAQYMIFDFSKLEDDKLSIVGFTTTHNKGITSAHDFVNTNLMGEDNGVIATLKSYLSRFDNSKNIYKVLASCGIDPTLVAQYDKPLYKWDREALMDYLYECVNAENVDILKSTDDKLLLSVRDKNIRYFLGDAYIDNISRDYWGEQHIIFIDFSLSQYDPSKLQFAIIADGSSDEDYCMAMYNESSMQIPNDFDSKLAEFGVPYDIIRRTDNIARRFSDAFMSFNMPVVRYCMEKDKNVFKNVLKNTIGSGEELYSVIRRTICDVLSFDYLNLFYDNGYYLSEFLEGGYVAELFKCVLSNLISSGRQMFVGNNFKMVDDNDIELFYNELMQDRRNVIYTGSYLLLKLMIEKEQGERVDYQRIYGKFNSFLFSKGLKGDMIKNLFLMTSGRIPTDKNSDALLYFVKYSMFYGDEDMQAAVKEMSEKSAACKKNYDSCVAELETMQKRLEEREVNTVTVDGGRHRIFAYHIDEPQLRYAVEDARLAQELNGRRDG